MKHDSDMIHGSCSPYCEACKYEALEQESARLWTSIEAAERDVKGLRRERDELRALIADDAYAMTFQSLGQYRAALLRR